MRIKRWGILPRTEIRYSASLRRGQGTQQPRCAVAVSFFEKASLLVTLAPASPPSLTGFGLEFRKMHGLGNDFVVIDMRGQSEQFSQWHLARIADRRFGIGCDQLIVLEETPSADIRMRIFNPDGGEVEACGNATRCIARLIAEETGRERITIETVAGLLVGTMKGELVAVDMGRPELGWSAIPLSGNGGDTARIPLDASAIDPSLPPFFSAVNMGNPHGVFFVGDAQALDIARIGPPLETHPIFPKKANISFAEILSTDHIRLRVWERAAGATLACGSAACATGVAALRLGHCRGEMRIELPGGTLLIRQEPNGHVIMTGPATLSFTGTLSPEMFEGVAA